jgi:hypothetical protein
MKLLDRLFKKTVQVVPEVEAEKVYQRFYGGRIHRTKYIKRNL